MPPVCDWLALFDIRPSAAIGYSLGESAMLFGLRAWTDRDEMLRRMEASPLFGADLVQPFDAARRAWRVKAGDDVPWLSGVVDRSADEIRAALTHHRRVYLLIVNTPRQCVIGGQRDQVEALIARLQASFVPLPCPSTVHCEVLRPVEKAYTNLHLMETAQPPGIDFYSAAAGKPYSVNRQSAADAILAQARDTVDFPRVIENAYADGVRLFLEMGPGSSCTKMIGEILAGREHLARAVCPATSEPIRHALSILAELIVHRAPVDLTALYGAEERDPVKAVPGLPGKCVVTPVAAPPFPSTRELQRLVIGTAPRPLPAPMVTTNGHGRGDPAPAPWPVSPGRPRPGAEQAYGPRSRTTGG